MVDGRAVEVPDRGVSLLEVLREDLGVRSAKDGLQGAGFAINNPNAQRTCGCGQSFS